MLVLRLRPPTRALSTVAKPVGPSVFMRRTRNRPGHLAFMGATAAVAGFSGTTVLCSPVQGSAPAEGHQDAAQKFLSHVTVVPYGVLGTQLSKSKSFAQVEPLPNENTVIVDPAGLPYIQPPGGPKGAGGAAGSIYKWLGIANDDRFPSEVIRGVQQTGDAKYHAYGAEKHVIHAVGPDLRTRSYSWEEAVEELAAAYSNILREFAGCGLPTLRLLPVSGGIFAGPYSQQVPTLTLAALRQGFLLLPEPEQRRVLDRKVLLCIFAEAEVPGFLAAFGPEQGMTAKL